MREKKAAGLTTREAAALVGLSPSYLNAMRCRPSKTMAALPYQKEPGLRGRVTYDRATLLSWNRTRLAAAKAAEKTAAKAKAARAPKRRAKTPVKEAA